MAKKVTLREIAQAWEVQDPDQEIEVATGTEMTEREEADSREESKEEVHLHPDLTKREGAAQEDHLRGQIEKFVLLMMKLKVKDKEKIKETILIRNMCLIIKV